MYIANRVPPFIMALLITLAPTQSAWSNDAQEKQAPTYKPSAEAMILDGLVYRPISLASTAVGTGIFIVTLPFSLLGGNVKQAGKTLVMDPARETFSRCLGCFPDMREEHGYR